MSSNINLPDSPINKPIPIIIMPIPSNGTCNGCLFHRVTEEDCTRIECNCYQRADKTDVIFVPYKESP